MAASDGAASPSATFTINGVPSVTSLGPNSATAGASAFSLTVNGTNFVNGTVVQWNGQNRTTTFSGPTAVSANIPATDLQSSGTANVGAITPDGVTSSNTQPFTIGAMQSITSLNPVSHTVGFGAFTLTINGSNFSNTMVALWNGTSRTTNFVNASQLTVSIPGDRRAIGRRGQRHRQKHRRRRVQRRLVHRQ